MNTGSLIINWYNKNKRSLPWRDIRNPYLIWLSEIILQQTRIEQGLAYYIKFAESYPDVLSLAKAKEDDVLKMWQGLGYYSRARNLHAAAKQIASEFGGKFPSDYKSIRSLRGVGDYTAAAIASFAFDEKYPVVDGNVFRFLSRYFGIETPIDTMAGKKEFTKIAGELMKDLPPATFNQAIMEFGARQCKPGIPDCNGCPLAASCFAYNKKSIASFPVKKNKIRTRNRYFNYLVIHQKDSVYIKKRSNKDIWLGLHDFPLIETKKRMKEATILQSAEWKETFGGRKTKLVSVSPEYKHVLSHQLIYARFYEVSIDQMKEPDSEWKKVKRNAINRYAIPKLIENYLKERDI